MNIELRDGDQKDECMLAADISICEVGDILINNK